MDLLNIIVQLINAALQVYLAFLFFSLFHKRKYNKKIEMPIIAALILFMLIGLLFFRGTPIVYLFTLMPIFCLTFLFNNNLKSKIVYFFLYNAISVGFEAVIAMMIKIIINIEVEDITGYYYIFGVFATKLLTYVVIAIIKVKKFKPLISIKSSHNWGLFIFPVSSLFTMILHHIFLSNTPIENNFIPYFVLLSYTILLVSNIIVFEYIDTISNNSMYQERIAASNEVIKQQTDQYNALIKHNEDIIKIQHDNKHFNLGLISEIESGNISEALKQLRAVTRVNENQILYSGNIIHSIISIKSNEASKYNTVIEFNYSELQKILISSIDLAIILGNALDNAIEACSKISERQKTIDLTILPRNNTVIISVTNPTADDVDISKLESSKPNKDLHGYGILSIRTITEKYGGDMAISYKNHVFTLSIVLNNVAQIND